MSDGASIGQVRMEAFDEGNRSLGALAPILLLFAAIIGATRIPSIQSFLHLSTTHAALAVVPMFLAATSATIVYQLAGGRSRIYRVIDRLETITIQFGTTGLALASEGGRSFFWFCYFAHTMLVGFSGSTPRMSRVVVAAAPLAAAVGFLWRGETEAAVVAAANAALGLSIALGGQYTHRRISEISAERDRLRQEVLALQVAQERTRIARDLHDGVAAELTALSARLDAIELEEDDPSQRALVDGLKRRARGSIDELRAVVWRLRAPERSFAELTSYAEATARALCPKGVAMKFVVAPEDDDTRIPGQVGLHALRIILELVRNAITHGAPTTITVEVSLDTTLSLSVTDDGRGIDEAGLAEIRSRCVGGLANIRARVDELGGSMRIDAKEVGFSVTVAWPPPGDVEPAA